MQPLLDSILKPSTKHSQAYGFLFDLLSDRTVRSWSTSASLLHAGAMVARTDGAIDAHGTDAEEPRSDVHDDRDDDDDVLEDELERDVELAPPCELGISPLCGQHEACRSAP